jgi:hypothetical protein
VILHLDEHFPHVGEAKRVGVARSGSTHHANASAGTPQTPGSHRKAGPTAIDVYLMFGLAEAKALIIRHRDAVLAIANALMLHRTLDAVMIHEIIASAPEHARRADWELVEKNAAGLQGSWAPCSLART